MLLFCINLNHLPQVYAIQFVRATLFSKALFSVDKMHMHVFYLGLFVHILTWLGCKNIEVGPIEKK